MESKQYLKNVKVIKKYGTLQDYDFNKIIIAFSKSAARVNYTISEFEIKEMQTMVESILADYLMRMGLILYLYLLCIQQLKRL